MIKVYLLKLVGDVDDDDESIRRGRDLR